MTKESYRKIAKITIQEILIPFLVSVLIFLLIYIPLVLVTGTTAPIRIVDIDMPVWYQNSMYPTFITGDILIVQKVDPKQLKVGDVIVFNRPYSDKPIVHRIIEIINEGGNLKFRVKGDFNPVADYYLVREQDIIAKWTGYKIQLIGLIFLAAQTPIGRIIIVAIVLFYLISTFKEELR